MNRHFLLAPGVDLIGFVAGMLLERGPLDRAMVIFPGKRPAHFLHKHLADRLKTAYVPPRVFSMDTFVESVVAGAADAGRAVDTADCIAALYGLQKNSAPVGSFELDEFLNWGYRILSDFEELYIEKITPDRLAAVLPLIGDDLPVPVRAKMASLSSLYRDFYGLLETQKTRTRSRSYRQASDRIRQAEFAGFDRIFVAGFFALTESEREICRHMAADERVHFIFQDGPGVSRTIDALALVPTRVGVEAPPPAVRFHKAADRHAEVFGLAEVIRQEPGLGPADVIVAPVPDSVFALVHGALGAVGKYNISMGFPLYRTALYTLITAIGRVAETAQNGFLSAADYLKLVLHPIVKNAFFDRASYPGRIIFHAVEEKFIERSRRFFTLEELENDQELLADCVGRLRGYQDGAIGRESVGRHLAVIHNILIRPFDRIADIGDCTGKVLAAVSCLSEKSPASEHPFTAAFIKALIDGLHELRQSALARERLNSPGSYFRVIRNHVRTMYHPFPGTPLSGLQVLGVLETRNLKFDRVFILDLNEGVWPELAGENTLLPKSVRRALKLPTGDDRERIARYYFDTLIRGCRQADIFYIEAEDRERSRYVERLIWGGQRQARRLDDPVSPRFFPVQFRQAEPAPVKKTPRFQDFVERGICLSASGLDTYLACPVMFYFERVLGLAAKREVADSPDALGVGSIVHKLLKKFFVAKIGAALTIDEADCRRMDRLIDEAFGEEYPDADRGSIYLVKAQIRRRMRDLLRFHASDERFGGAAVLECENAARPGGSRPAPIKANLAVGSGRPVTLIGFIDRVDRRQGGEIRIIDYKTGRSADLPRHEAFDPAQRAAWPRTLKSVQLPVYVWLYLANHPDLAVGSVNAGLMLLGGKKIEEKWLFPEAMDAAGRRVLFEKYRSAIEALVSEIIDPDLDFRPAPDDKACGGCDYAVICGRQHVMKTW